MNGSFSSGDDAEAGQDKEISLGPGLAEKDYATWLRVGVRCYFHDKGSPMTAFPGLGSCYGLGEILVDDIVAAIMQLPARDLEKMRNAVVCVIREIPFNKPEEADTVCSLFSIAFGIKALGALKVIARKTFTFDTTGPFPQTTMRMVIAAFEFARDLAPLSSDAELCLKRIVVLPNFPDAFAAQALVALTQGSTDANDFPSHLELLWPLLDRQFGQQAVRKIGYETVEQSRRLLLCQLLRLGVPIKDLIGVRTDGVNWWVSSLYSELTLDEQQQAFPNGHDEKPHTAQPYIRLVVDNTLNIEVPDTYSEEKKCEISELLNKEIPSKQKNKEKKNSSICSEYMSDILLQNVMDIKMGITYARI